MSNMVIRTNVMALNSHRSLGMTGAMQRNASARLSSGFRINSAADDAAGLAISEKMRAQIRGLNQASRNTQDGISLIQTAEGGLQEINEMLQRMRELVNQAANDTNDFATDDRRKIQDEIDQLTQGIDAMANSVEFNAKRLLDGSLLDNASRSQLLGDLDRRLTGAVGVATSLVNLDNSVAGQRNGNAITGGAGSLGTLWAANSAGNSATLVPSSASYAGTAVTNTVNTTGHFMTNVTTSFSTSSSVAGSQTTVCTVGGYNASGVTTTFTGTTWSADTDNNSTFGTGTLTIPATVNSTTTTVATTDGSRASLAAQTTSFRGLNDSSIWSTDANMEAYIAELQTFISAVQNANRGGDVDAGVMTVITQAQRAMQAARDIRAGHVEMEANIRSMNAMSHISGNGLWFQTGANSMQGISVGIGSVNTNVLGIGNGFGETWVNVDQDSGTAVSAFINVVDTAMEMVTAKRAMLGAVQNRLEHTDNSLNIASENLSAAESRVRDADMAAEMMRLTQSNVLQQAATAMLAQANQSPQMILQLLG